jgi:hypothetical protein
MASGLVPKIIRTCIFYNFRQNNLSNLHAYVLPEKQGLALTNPLTFFPAGRAAICAGFVEVSDQSGLEHRSGVADMGRTQFPWTPICPGNPE